jgi:hypothetical protein
MVTIFSAPELFYNHIKNAKIKMPEDFRDYNSKDYPNFDLFMLLHLGKPINVYCLEENANIIADLTPDEIETITLSELCERGLYIASDSYIV